MDSLKKLSQAGGVRVVRHWSGRKKRDIRKPIPKGTQAVVLVLDRVNHALARHVRKESDRLGVPVLFQRRSFQTESTRRSPESLRAQLGRFASRKSRG